ncbi:MAG: hypothetical protein KDA24_14045 [Deltaproteobacteria bacterium]|nr:hypothetical protein [Deltaproteobacteria bacterium]
MRHILLPLTLLALTGCPSGDPEPAEPMNIAANYVVAGQQLDSECVGADWDFWEIFDFMERTPQDVPSMTLAVTQSGGAIEASQGPAGCVLSGTVGPTGTFSLRGECDTATMDRDLEINGSVVAFGAGFDIDANLSIGVDRDDGAGGDPDGLLDCTVGNVELSGTGTPPD